MTAFWDQKHCILVKTVRMFMRNLLPPSLNLVMEVQKVQSLCGEGLYGLKIWKCIRLVNFTEGE